MPRVRLDLRHGEFIPDGLEAVFIDLEAAPVQAAAPSAKFAAAVR